MPAAKPCLGYPSRSAACVALSRQGVPDDEIARRIGITAKDVGALLASAARANAHANGGFVVRFDDATLEALKAHAVVRKMSARQLVRRLVAVAIENNLLDAILDDGGGKAWSSPP